MSGPWEKYGRGTAPQGIPIGAQDPAMPYKAPAAALDLQAKQANMDNDAQRIALERQRLQIAEQAGQRAQQAADAARLISQRDANAKAAPLTALEQQIARVRDLYNKGPGATRGIGGVLDYLPTPRNQQFDAAGAALAEIGQSAFRTPGVGSQSDKELKAFIEANRPYASDYDATIQEKLRNLQTRLAAARNAQGVAPAPRRQPQATTWYGTPRNAPRKPASNVIDFNDWKD